MNKIILTNARLGRDIEMRYSSENKPMARFSVATDRKFSKEKKTDWFNCIAFGSIATFCEKYLHKGSKVNIEGRPQPDVYENKEGQKVYSFEVVVDDIEFGESKKEADAHAEASSDKAETSDEGFEKVLDEESLPFNGG